MFPLPWTDSNEVFCPVAEPDRNLEFHGRMDAAAADRGRRMQWQCRARSRAAAAVGRAHAAKGDVTKAEGREEGRELTD